MTSASPVLMSRMSVTGLLTTPDLTARPPRDTSPFSQPPQPGTARFPAGGGLAGPLRDGLAGPLRDGLGGPVRSATPTASRRDPPAPGWRAGAAWIRP